MRDSATCFYVNTSRSDGEKIVRMRSDLTFTLRVSICTHERTRTWHVSSSMISSHLYDTRSYTYTPTLTSRARISDAAHVRTSHVSGLKFDAAIVTRTSAATRTDMLVFVCAAGGGDLYTAAYSRGVANKQPLTHHSPIDCSIFVQ